jgi:hypothetical protein
MQVTLCAACEDDLSQQRLWKLLEQLLVGMTVAIRVQ